MVNLRLDQPVISFTFDDFPKSALHSGGSILRRYGAHGTYYVSLGLKGRAIPAGPAFSDLELLQVIDDGHELGCHTFDHCHAWDTRPARFEQSIIANGKALSELRPNWVLKTLSYPIACPRPGTKRRAAKYFACCRGGGQTLNVGRTDLNSLKACFLEKCKNSPEFVEELIEENCRAKGWLIFATHDICEDPSPFGCRPQFFEKVVKRAVDSGAKVLPVAKAWEEISSRI